MEQLLVAIGHAVYIAIGHLSNHGRDRRTRAGFTDGGATPCHFGACLHVEETRRCQFVRCIDALTRCKNMSGMR